MSKFSSLAAFSALILCGCGGAMSAQVTADVTAHTESLSTTAVIRSGQDSTYCLTARGGGTTDGTPVDVEKCNGSASQLWTVNGGQLQNAGKCLDDTGGNTSNGAPIELWTCWGGSNQQWNTANSQLQLAGTNQCVDIPAANITAAPQLQLYSCWGGANQKWVLASPSVTIPDKSLGARPALGWNSWNAFGCQVNESLIKASADALVSSGMQSAGYQYVILDDCWAASRDGQGTLVADGTNFPSGIAALASYVHQKGLKFGLYTSAGTQTCAQRPGSYGYEAHDMATFAQWGVDYVKIDWCNTNGLTPHIQYPLFSQGIAAAGRPMIVSLSDFGEDQVWTWGASVANSWRTTDDINDSWTSVMGNMFSNARFPAYAGPGGFNDLDMLEVGNGGMTRTEDKTHFSIWAIEASPLIAGTDLRSISTATRAILTNPEVLAVNQDSRGLQGQFVYNDNNVAVIAKPLANGAVAMVLFNMTASAADITASFGNAGLSTTTSYAVRDLWARADLGRFVGSYTARQVPAHGAVMITVSP